MPDETLEFDVAELMLISISCPRDKLNVYSLLPRRSRTRCYPTVCRYRTPLLAAGDERDAAAAVEDERTTNDRRRTLDAVEPLPRRSKTNAEDASNEQK